MAAVTCYVSPSGSNTSPYDTWAKAATLPATAISYAAGQNPDAGHHTIYIAPKDGGYASNIYPSGGWMNGCEIYGTANHGSETAPSSILDYPLIVATGANALGINSNVTGVIAKYLSLTSNWYAINMLGANHQLSDLNLFDSSKLIYVICTGFTLNRIKAAGCSGSGSAIQFDGASAGDINNLIATDTENYPLAIGTAAAIVGNQSGTLNFNNILSIGQLGVNFTQIGAGITNFTNSEMFSAMGYYSGYALSRGAGTLTATNCLLVGLWNSATFPVTNGTITKTDCIETSQPFFVKRSRFGYIVPRFDDAANADYAVSLIDTFKSRGMKATHFVETANVPANLTDLENENSDGTIELGVHSYSHANLSLTGNVFSITKAAHTINVDRANDQIVVDGAAPVTVTGFRAKTLVAIRAELVTGGCTLGSTTAGLTNTIGEVLDDSSGAQASPYTTQLLIDATGATGFFKVEFVDPKAQFESYFGVKPLLSFACPYGFTAPDLPALALLTGYGSLSSSIGASSSHLLSSFNRFALGYLWVNTIVSVDDATTRARTRMICEFVAHAGGFVQLLAHDATEATIAQWVVILDTIKNEYPEITVTSLGEVLDTIINGGLWTTADDITYTRTIAPDPDYHLQASSPCKNVGIDVGLTTDYEGNSVPFAGGYPIGPYRSPATGGGLSPGLGLSGGNRPPWWNRRRR